MARRLHVLVERGALDYTGVGYEHLHAWRLNDGEVPGVEWCDRVPAVLPSELACTVYVTAAPRMFWSPSGGESADAWPTWVARLQAAMRRGARAGECAVVADGHV